MRFILAFVATALIAAPLAAESVAPSGTIAPKRGATLRDAKSLRLGTIDRVNADGSVQVIFDSHFVTIPADKLVVAADGVATSLTKAEVSRLH
jgi:hypothetical protein